MTATAVLKQPLTATALTPESNVGAGLLEVKDLRVTYGSRVAVDGVSLSVRAGEICGLLGPNGAGKTSTLSAIEGLLVPSAGTVLVAGIDVQERPVAVRANLGVQLQTTSFQKELGVSEILRLYAGLYGLRLTGARIRSLLAIMELGDHGSTRTAQLSGGQRQRLTLATATLHDPPLLLLDEPTTGLDPQARRIFWSKIEELRDSGRGILLTTHSMEEAHAVCDRVFIIDHGRIIASGSPESIVDSNKHRPEVIAVAHRANVTLEDVFIGLTGTNGVDQ